MVWAPRNYDLTRPMNHDTLVALAGKLAVGDGPREGPGVLVVAELGKR